MTAIAARPGAVAGAKIVSGSTRGRARLS